MRPPHSPPMEATPSAVRLQDSKQISLPSIISALAKRTLPIGPAAPPAPSPSGQIAASKASTSPLAPVRSGTKKVERAALIKALAQSTTPVPTSAAGTAPLPSSVSTPIRAPSPDAVSANGAPASIHEAKTAPVPYVLKELTAKTVPMRRAPVVPAVGNPGVTEPLPSRSAFRPTAAIGVLSSITKRLSKRLGRTSRDETPEIPADVSTPETASEMPALTPEESTAAAGEETPRKSSRRLMPFLLLVAAVTAAAAAYYVWSPYHAAALLRNALNDGDAADLEKAVDFPSVRNSLKAQIRNQLAASGKGVQSGSPAGSAFSDVLSMIDSSIDLYLTPEGLSSLVKKSAPPGTPQGAQTISADTAATILLEFNNRPVQQEGLAGVNDFVVDLDTALLHFQFDGLGWKLKRIDVRPDAQASILGTPATTPTLISPVIDTYLQRGESLAGKGDWDGAIALFSQVLAIDPHSSAAYADRASARRAKGDLDGALKDYTQALTIDPGMASVYNDRGSVKAAKNDSDGAMADFTEAIRLDPVLAPAYDSRGNIRLAKSDLDGAIVDYTHAIALDPNLASAYSDRAYARQANGNLDGAISDYTQALTLNPQKAVDYYNRGLARQAQGSIETAILDFDRAITLNPKLTAAYFSRGVARNANHDVDGAISDYTQALTLDPTIALAYSNRGLARQGKGNLDGALADFNQALALDPKIAMAYYERGVIKEQRNDLDGAIADTSQALDLDPKNALAYYNRGFAKLTKGNLDGALADLKEFCEIAPTDHFADHARLYLWLIAKAQNAKGDPDQELSDALQNGWNSSGDDMATKTAAFLLGRLSEPDFLTSASSTDAKTDQSQQCEAWYFVGMKRLLMGDKKGAIDAFHRCVATGQTDYCEYILARAELQALEQPAVAIPVARPVAVPTNPVALPVTPPVLRP
jgi:tetratricopeptide (TPR) repeat protein